MTVLHVTTATWNAEYFGNPDIDVSAINTSGAFVKGYIGGTITPGTGGSPGVYAGVSLTGGTGSGATADITIDAAGGVWAVRIINPGTGYVAGDTLTATVGSPSAVTGFSIPVSSVGIASTRTSGQTPCMIQFSASPISCTGTGPSGQPIRPYEDLMFSWNFDDPTGAETFVRPTDGVTVNANTDQQSPEAAYVYRNAGSYTVRLTITGKSGSGYTTSTVTLPITVSAFNPSFEYWADSNAGGTNAGTLANPFNTVTAINAATINKSNWRLNVAQGSVFTGAGCLDLGGQTNTTTGGIRVNNYVGASGAGANPLFSLTSAPGATEEGAIYVTNGSFGTARPKSDIVISGVDAACSVTGKAAFKFTGIPYRATNAGTLSDIYLDNCSGTASHSGASVYNAVNWSGVPTLTNFGIWGGAFVNSVALNGVSVFGTGCHWFSMYGLSFAGDALNNILHHYIYSGTQTHQVFKWLAFPTTTQSGLNYCIDTNWNTMSGGLEYAEFTCASEIRYGGALRSIDAGESAADTVTFNGTATIAISGTQNPAIQVGQQVMFLSELTTTTAPVGVPLYVTAIGTGTIEASLTKGGAAITPTAGGTTYLARTIYQSFVAERSAFTNMLGNSFMYFDRGQYITARDNRIWGCPNGPFVVAAGMSNSLISSRVYRNRGYISSGSTSALYSVVVNASNGSPYTKYQQYVDNITVDERTVAYMAQTVFVDQVAAGSLWDRNQYYTPNDASSPDTYFTATWALTPYVAFGPQATPGTWQNSGFDLNGSELVAPPAGWTTPATQWSHFG